MAIEGVGMAEIFGIIIENPLLFLLMTFITGSLRNGPIFLTLLAVMTSIFTYPFIFLGIWILKKQMMKIEEFNDWQKELVTVISLSFIFWILIRVWYVLAGSSFITDIPGFIAWALITGFVAYLFYLGAKKTHLIFTDKWEMPKPLSYFIVNYAFNLIGWILLYIIIIVISMDTAFI
ncbi:MAG: hypothetical protein ACOCTT_00030 [archaeon]